MRIQVLQHVPYEGPASIGAWALVRGHAIRQTKLHEGAPLPPEKEVDFLVIMGGPMGVGEREKFPWMNPEIAFVEKMIRAGKPVLGICLGAQIMAAALGARVAPAAVREIGWWPVRKTAAGKASPLLKDLPDGSPVFHWHGDTWELPAGAVHLLGSDAVKQQAFSWGKRALALQCHLELTADTVRGLVDNGRAELVASRWVQSESAVLEGTVRCQAMNKVLVSVLDRLTR